MNICHHNWKNSHGSGKFPANRWKDAARTPSNLRVFGWVHVYRVTNKFSNQCFTIISFEIKLFLIDWYELHKTINLCDHNYDTPLCNIRQSYNNALSYIGAIDVLLHVWSCMSLSKYVYYLLQWELRLSTENVSEVSKGDNKKVFSETEGYESVWFWSVFPTSV